MKANHESALDDEGGSIPITESHKTSVDLVCVPGPHLAKYAIAAISLIIQQNSEVIFNVKIVTLKKNTAEESEFRHAFEGVEILTFQEEQLSLQDPENGSSQHGALLNEAIKSLSNSNPLLILDPDFFAVQAGLVKDILKIMSDRGRMFVGVTYPTWKTSDFWDFPVAHFMMVSSEVNFHSLDFSPGWESKRLARKPVLARSVFQKLTGFMSTWMSRIQAVLADFRASFLGKERFFRDTGYKLRKLEHFRDSSEVLSYLHRQTSTKFPRKFDLGSYLRLNPDVVRDLDFAQFHLQNLGLKEHRRLGLANLPTVIRSRIKYPFRTPTRTLSHIIPKSFVERGLLAKIETANPLVDFYFWNGNLAGMHLNGLGRQGFELDIALVSAFVEGASTSGRKNPPLHS